MKIVALATLVAASCAFLFAPDLPDMSGHFTPPPAYREIWEEAKACTNTTGDFDRIQWYSVPGHDFNCPAGKCIGEWVPPHSIAIAEEWRNIAWVVKHEMIHDLTKLSHDRGPRDIQIWGVQCHAMWGYLNSDTTYIP